MAGAGVAPSRAARSSRSALLNASRRGFSPAPSSSRTVWTVARCSSKWPSEASTTSTRTSARLTSSSVARKASTSWCGSLWMKPDGVGDDRGLAVAELDLAAGRIERGEQLVLGPRDLGADERVEQRGLAGVRVADDADGRPQPAVAAAGGGLALLADLLDALLHLRDPRPDDPPVGLELALAGSARADPALGPRQVGPQLGQARQLVLELGELDLEPALVGLGVEREDVEDQPAAVDDLDVEQAPRARAAGPATARRRRRAGRSRSRAWPRRAPRPCPCRRTSSGRRGGGSATRRRPRRRPPSWPGWRARRASPRRSSRRRCRCRRRRGRPSRRAVARSIRSVGIAAKDSRGRPSDRPVATDFDRISRCNRQAILCAARARPTRRRDLREGCTAHASTYRRHAPRTRAPALAGLFEIWRTLVFLGIANFTFVGKEVAFKDPQWGQAFWAILLAAIWFWVAEGFWNVRAYAWSFGIFISLFTLIFGFFAAPRLGRRWRPSSSPMLHRVPDLLLPELPGRPAAVHRARDVAPDPRAAGRDRADAGRAARDGRQRPRRQPPHRAARRPRRAPPAAAVRASASVLRRPPRSGHAARSTSRSAPRGSVSFAVRASAATARRRSSAAVDRQRRRWRRASRCPAPSGTRSAGAWRTRRCAGRRARSRRRSVSSPSRTAHASR